MADGVIERRKVSVGIRDMYAAAAPPNGDPADFATFLERVPDDPFMPYVVIDPLFGGRVWGTPLDKPEKNADLPYQVTSVGRTEEQAEVLGDVARWIMVGRGADRDFLFALLADGHAILDREITDTVGAVESTGGLWNAYDRFTVKVAAT